MTIIDIESPRVTDQDHASRVAPAPAPVVAPPAGRPTGAPAVATAAATAPERAPSPPKRRLLADPTGPMSGAWAIGLAVAWVAVVALGRVVQPVPVNPDAAPPLIADLLNAILLGTWGAMAAGMIQRRRFAAVASLAGGVGLLALTLGCPVSGHHGFGAWWGVQIVGALALLALSRRALRSS